MLVQKSLGPKEFLVQKEFLSFFSWAEQCQTQQFYLRFLKSNLDAVKVNQGDNIKNEGDLKKEDDPKMKATSKMKTS